jgi:hypothetical protein
MINCEEYRQILKNIGLDRVGTHTPEEVIILVAGHIFKMLEQDEIGLEWFFSLIHDLGIYTGWYESILERGDGS